MERVFSCREDLYQYLQFTGLFPYRDAVGKFRPQLLEITSFKSKLLIRFIMIKVVKTNKHQYHVKIMQ